VLLWAHPHVAVAPLAQLAQLLHFGMIVQHVILLWETGGVVHAYVAA
jgi:hypothetical protein